MGSDREIEVLVGNERVVLKKEALKQIILSSIIGGAIASCELEGEVFSEEEKDVLLKYHPANGVLD